MRTERSRSGVHIEVGIRDFRAHLKDWLDQVESGEEILVTDRGRPIARIVPVARASKLDQLIAEGRVTPAKKPATPFWEDPIPIEGSIMEFLRRQRR